MKKRYLYALLFGIPGFFIAGSLSLFVFGAILGMLWLFVFGDTAWPVSVETILSISLVLVFLISWVLLIAVGYLVGRRLENNPATNRTHLLISGGLTLLFIVFVLIHQWSMGNLGPRSDSAVCSDFCSLHGYSASGTPPLNSGSQMCSCYDDSGNEVLTIPLDHLQPRGP